MFIFFKLYKEFRQCKAYLKFTKMEKKLFLKELHRELFKYATAYFTDFIKIRILVPASLPSMK
ncbi:hypothetical protein BBI01_08080 [Chryseobacterium artocarpi]|uniref:Uncharacterized protein n=1 Tax=Chryseobacterium artocarpi TaxID=1414727 RepID=A0A1B8ZKH6_9FLAO|nr:hypothetical protein BBI01_08080 [Chryseobacterium artocarpi]